MNVNVNANVNVNVSVACSNESECDCDYFNVIRCPMVRTSTEQRFFEMWYGIHGPVD